MDSQYPRSAFLGHYAEDDRPEYDLEAVRLAWRRTIAFFERTLPAG